MTFDVKLVALSDTNTDGKLNLQITCSSRQLAAVTAVESFVATATKYFVKSHVAAKI